MAIIGGVLGHPHPAVSSIYVGSLLGASKVSRVLGDMAGSSILGRPWLCLRMETINVDGGGAVSSDIHIHMLASSLNLHQAPQALRALDITAARSCSQKLQLQASASAAQPAQLEYYQFGRLAR